jgi:hypothetical protein
MFRLILIAVMAALSAGTACAQTAAVSRFDGWASAIVAADWRSSDGTPIEAFDNARRDLTSAFLAAGFSRAGMVDYSLRPDVSAPTSAGTVIQGIADVTARATRGCLLYFTSHGTPEALVFGETGTLSPTAMATLVRRWCQDRPTVIIVSACFSGIFVDGLAAPNRMIMTASRRDRSSFGCSEDAVYPYFDGCVIQSLPTASDFIALNNAVRACVQTREEAEGLSPASEPQVSIGANMQLALPTLRFSHPLP